MEPDPIRLAFEAWLTTHQPFASITLDNIFAAGAKWAIKEVLAIVQDHHDTVDNSDGVGGFPNLAMTITAAIRKHFGVED